MNKLIGKVSGRTNHDQLTRVQIEIGDVTLHAMVLEDDSMASKLIETNRSVLVLFKATEVILQKGAACELSIVNQIPCMVVDIIPGVLLSAIEMSFGTFLIKAIIPAQSVSQMGLRQGGAVTAMIKENEIMLADS